MSTSPEHEGQGAGFAPKQSGDTHSYRGWLNSDSFLKRAFAVLGYSIVATLIIYIPIVVIALLVGGSALMMEVLDVETTQQTRGEWGGDEQYRGNPYEEEYVPSEDVSPAPAAKLDIRAVCEGALAYMTFASGAEADAFVEDCIAGNRPEVIERYRAEMGVSQEAAL